nr:MAG TPA: YopX protein [Caudoviricetes sp.]
MIPRYRAWLKYEGCFADSIESIRYDKETIFLKWGGFGRGDRFEFYEVELMQSTGLFDKNGKEIFEGDIVRFFDSLYTVFYDIEEGSYRLKPHDDRWVVDYMSNFSSEESFEIIGNIYENKEQLW